ncbi:hypothetical protein T492DRAFT_864839 [Pavlovales sp. CCMP2436]|nr:hypothetical protein T492DRAFT_864839 [Pavlovales sp. CCMP2436]
MSACRDLWRLLLKQTCKAASVLGAARTLAAVGAAGALAVDGTQEETAIVERARGGLGALNELSALLRKSAGAAAGAADAEAGE